MSMSFIIDNTQMVLGEFQESMSNAREEKEALNVRLRETLARNESLRKKDFDVMMNTILVSQDDREREVKKLLHNYLTEQREMARQLKENLGTFKEGLNKVNIGRINEFHEVLKDILKKQEERKAELAAKLKILQKEQGELSRSLGELLSKGRDLRIRDLKAMLKQFEVQSRERAAQRWERKERVQKMLGTFRKKGENQQTDKHARSVRTKEATMAMAHSMKNLAEQIITSHNVRVKALGDLALDTKKTLEDFAEERHVMGRKQRKDLQDLRDGLSKSVEDMLTDFHKKHRKMGSEQAKDLSEFSHNLMANTKKMLDRVFEGTPPDGQWTGKGPVGFCRGTHKGCRLHGEQAQKNTG